MRLKRRAFIGLLGYGLPTVGGCQASTPSTSRADSLQNALSFLQRTEFTGLACTSARTGQPTRIDGQGLVFVAGFLTAAAGAVMEAKQRARLAARLRGLYREEGWGYSVNAPSDSDDTAFALHALLNLGAGPDSDEIVDGTRALDRFRRAGSEWYQTFHGDGVSRIARHGGDHENLAVHLGVNANIQSLRVRLGKNTPRALAVLLAQCRTLASSKSFYYPFEMYTMALVLPMLDMRTEAHRRVGEILGKEIVGRQRSDGSWGEDPVETALALDALRPLPNAELARDRGIAWLVSEQESDGSWETERPIWRFPTPGDDEWRAYDSQRLVATSLATRALKSTSG